MKKTILTTAVVLIAVLLQAQKLTPTNLKNLEGAWVGSLTYLDYVSNKPITMPANTTYLQSTSNPNIYLRSIGYSTEPHANKKDSLILSNDGTALNEEKVVAVKLFSKDSIVIVTQVKDIDGNDNKPAIIQHTLTITPTLFINKKEVKFIGTKNWINRSTYTFTKKVK